MLFSVQPANAYTFGGPFEVKDELPIFLPLNQPYIEPAETASSLSLSLSHSSVFMAKDSARWSSHLDLELTELNIRYKKDFPGLFELGVELPFLRPTGGFMDRPLNWYHRLIGTPNTYGRLSRPRNEFLYEFKKDGNPVILGENDRTGPGDVRISVKKKLIEGPLTVSLLGDLELPTGNARVGFGNGSFDTGLALLLESGLGEDARLYANMGAVLPGDLKAYQKISLQTYYYGGACVEYFAWQDLSVLAQVMVQTSPYPDTGIREIDTTAVFLVLGGRYYSGAHSLEFSLTEDPNTVGAPDFGLNLTFKTRY